MTDTPQIRAGRYAVVDRVAYSCIPYFEGSPTWLSAPHDQPRPPGFTAGPVGGWRRRVLPEEISELIEVATTARWRGRPVIVKGVSGDSAFLDDVRHDLDGRLKLPDPPGTLDHHYVPVTDLTEVIEQTVRLPLPPIGSAWADGPVRAGLYAVYRGSTYVASGLTHSDGDRHRRPIILLWAPKNDPRPDGFEPDRRGDWRRAVPLEDVIAAFTVQTTARWKGNPVGVLRVRGDRADIQYIDNDIDGRPELNYQQHGMWEGWVPVDSLTHVIQLPRDVALKIPHDPT